MRRLLPLLIVLAACETAPRPETHAEPRSPADSLAHRLATASGAEAWEQLPALRFSFGFERDGAVTYAAHHLWDRQRGRYRVEWPGGAPGDSVYVAIFDHWPDSVRVYRGGAAVDRIGDAPAGDIARRRSINDSYWLLAPLKVFDEGVRRTHAADSATTTHDVLHLTFDGVGLTPGDQYWLFVNRESGLLERWTFLLQGAETSRSFRWNGYEELSTGAPAGNGVIRLSTRKEAEHAPQTVLTDRLHTLRQPGDDWFTDPRPRLAERE